MDVVLQSRPPKYGPGRFQPNAALGHGCLTVLLLGPLENGGITGSFLPGLQFLRRSLCLVRLLLMVVVRTVAMKHAPAIRPW
jgi:hypothetical protein